MLLEKLYQSNNWYKMLQIEYMDHNSCCLYPFYVAILKLYVNVGGASIYSIHALQIANNVNVHAKTERKSVLE